MPRRIWVAEGIASDGDFYGRTLQLPDEKTRRRPAPAAAMDVQRTRASVVKSHLGDVPTCPCLGAVALQDHGTDRTPEFEPAPEVMDA
ncbi:hypothethical protein (plasmid) [Ralstonia solanacearum CMR15]|nr:hypothethical protein [Ralstonia solanacearum CMR15]